MKAALVAMALMTSAAQADMADFPALFDVTGVAANDMLQVRTAPSAGSNSVATLATDAKGVEVISLSEDGNWAEVTVDDMPGWASARYLAAQPGGEWWAGVAPLRCFGTEPFWGIAIDMATKKAVYSALDGIDKTMAIDRTWTHYYSYPASATVGIRFADRNAMAILKGEICSDGMSDRNYGVSIDLFLTDDEDLDLGWSGCCTLQP
jgi:uncharacterized membrane protein